MLDYGILVIYYIILYYIIVLNKIGSPHISNQNEICEIINCN